MEDKTYLCLDLKSFYASVECIERGLNPLTALLVVADASRTEKTIVLAVSPALKAHGVGGRPRLFEVIERVRFVNYDRKQAIRGRPFKDKSTEGPELEADPYLELDYIVAPPRMALYIQYSTWIYQVYLKYIAPEDIHVYSIDEVFIDLTPYLGPRKMSAHDMAMVIIRDVLETTGITATGGIGTNMYLAKVAMDIVAKKMPADEDGVRIAELDELAYRKKLWDHQPLRDFWRIGRGYSTKLARYGMLTMGDVARCSLDKSGQKLLYGLFGVNAELLIDHAWGWESCTLADVKAYRPTSNSLSSGQVLNRPYTAQEARVVIREMAEKLALDLVDKGLVTDQLVVTVSYDIDNCKGFRAEDYKGPVVIDAYGRKKPKHSRGTTNFDRHISYTSMIGDGVVALYDRIVDDKLLVRKLNVTANHVLPEMEQVIDKRPQQLDLFTDPDRLLADQKAQEAALEREKRIQKTVLKIKKRYGKNAILKGLNFREGATARERNAQIGGHKA